MDEETWFLEISKEISKKRFLHSFPKGSTGGNEFVRNVSKKFLKKFLGNFANCKNFLTTL